MRRLDVGAGTHTRPQGVRQKESPASGGTPGAGDSHIPKGGIFMENYTEHYQLHQWESEDSFLRTDFNADFAKIDGAIAACSHTVKGSYTGNGSYLTVELGFRPDQVAVCGFSAGGHLAGCLAGGYAEPLLNERLGLTPEQVRPDAAILGYPVVHEARYLDPLGGAEVLRPDRRVGPGHPPAFLWATVGDTTVPVENTLDYAHALRARQVPFELHLFQDGPHAMGLADRESARDGAHYNAHAAAWHPLCIDWLKGRG